MRSSILSITISICIFSSFLTCALTQDCSNPKAPGCTSKQFLSGKCDPSQCQSGCCVNGACAQESKDCQVGIQSFVFVASPFIFVFVLLVISLCVSIVKKSRRYASRAVTPATELPGVMQGQIVTQPDTKTQKLKSKIVPINIVEIHATTPIPSTTVSPNSRIVEISQEAFERHMIKDVEKILKKQERMIKVLRGAQVIIFRRNSMILPRTQSECDERVLTA